MWAVMSVFGHPTTKCQTHSPARPWHNCWVSCLQQLGHFLNDCDCPHIPTPAGQGGTPLETLNCFRPTSNPTPCSLSGLEMHGFGVQSAPENVKEGFGDSNGVHLYDFPSVDMSHSRSSDSYGGSQDGINGAVVGHSYEFPDHYHLATQYEVPVASYEKPRPRARLHIYKNTLPPDIYVPTLVYLLYILPLLITCEIHLL